MEAKSICIFEKHGGCKKTDCKFHQPIEDCEDETCDIRSCQKRHPQVRLYHRVLYALPSLAVKAARLAPSYFPSTAPRNWFAPDPVDGCTHV